MNASGLLNSRAAMTAAGVLAGGLVLYWLVKKSVPAVGEAAAAVGQAVNPVNPGNVFHSGVNAVGGAVSGRGSDWSLGSWLYDLTHKEYDPNAPAAARADEDSFIGNLWERIT